MPQQQRILNEILTYETRILLKLCDHNDIPAGTYKLKIEGEPSEGPINPIRCYDSFTRSRENSFSMPVTFDLTGFE